MPVDDKISSLTFARERQSGIDQSGRNRQSFRELKKGSLEAVKSGFSRIENQQTVVSIDIRADVAAVCAPRKRLKRQSVWEKLAA